MRGRDTNFYHVSPLRSLHVYILPRAADFYFDQINIGDKISCIVDKDTGIVLSVDRPEHQKIVDMLRNDKA